MRVLVDTHVFLWWAEGDRRLPAKARAALRDPDNECLFSLASVWEIAIKAGLGKLRLAVPVQRYVVEQIAANGFKLLEIRLPHLGRLASLAKHHRDPFDRLLVAQALEDQLAVITADKLFTKYGVKRIW